MTNEQVWKEVATVRHEIATRAVWDYLELRNGRVPTQHELLVEYQARSVHAQGTAAGKERAA